MDELKWRIGEVEKSIAAVNNFWKDHLDGAHFGHMSHVVSVLRRESDMLKSELWRMQQQNSAPPK